MKMVLGMIHKEREGFDLATSIENIRRGGFDQKIIISAEPGTPTAPALENVRIYYQPMQLGILGSAAWLLGKMLETSADIYIKMDNDILMAPFARERLEWLLERQVGAFRFGAVSLYTPINYQPILRTAHTHYDGWHTADPGWHNCAGQANCLTREGVEAALLDDRLPDMITRSLKNNGSGGGLDSLIGDWISKTRRDYWFHNPSLVQHLGITSSRLGYPDKPERVGLNVEEWM